jgi:hypothetical protein
MCDPNDGTKLPIMIPELLEFKDELNLPSKTIPWDASGKPIWAHIRDLNIPDVRGRDFGILVGVHCYEALRELEVRRFSNLPDAVRLPLGWCLRGSVSDVHHELSGSVSVNSFMPVIEDEPSLDLLVEKFWTTDTFGCKFSDEADLSSNHRYALDLLKKTIRRVPTGRSFDDMGTWVFIAT